jgi:hypothetical protein
LTCFSSRERIGSGAIFPNEDANRPWSLLAIYAEYAPELYQR